MSSEERKDETVSDTRFKLQETEYFFNQMKKLAAEDNNNSMTEFIFNLIAFVSAGRSVTFVMQYEYTRKGGPFAKWYCKNVDEALRKEEVPRFFRDLRNTILKQKGNPRGDVRKLITKTLFFGFNVIGSTTENKEEKSSEHKNFKPESPLPQQPPQPTITDDPDAEDPAEKYVWYVKSINDETETTRKYIIPTCDEYLQRLKGIVNECETLFGKYAVYKTYAKS